MMFEAHKIRSLFRLHLGFAVIVAILVGGIAESVSAQGLNGPGRRLEETLGQAGEGYEDGYGDDMDMEGDDEFGMDGYDMEMEMEMDMDGGGGGYGGGGSSRPSGPAPPQSDAIQTYASNLASLMDGFDMSSLFVSAAGAEAEIGPVLKTDAEGAFKSGDQSLALELLCGHMTAEYEDAFPVIKTVKYSRMLRKPVWNIRWGVSFNVRGGEGIDDPSPIKEGATPMGSRSRGGGGGGGGGGAMSMEMEMEMEMGDMGGMMEEMEDEMEGDMMAEMEREMMGGMGGRSSGRSAAPEAPAAPALPVRSMLNEPADEMLQKYLGLVATVSAEKFKERFESGDFGAALTSVSPPPPPAKPRGGRVSATTGPSFPMSPELGEALMEVGEPLPMWKPGLAYLGQGQSDEILPAARKANIDLLLHFDVVLKPGRNDTMANVSRCRLITVSNGKSVGVSKGMDTREASQMAGAGRMDEREYVEEQLTNLWGIIDKAKVESLPRLSPEMARKRVSQLMSSPRARSLQTLAEIRMYQAARLLEESEVEAAFDIIGGSDGLLMLHGPKAQRVATAREWAVASQGE